MDSLSYFEKIGVKIPTVLLPKKDIDMTKWSVIACDQYTSEPEYWAKVESIVGDSPSALKLTFPEVYLESGNSEERITKINSTMEKYIKENILEAHGPCFIYVDRKTSHTPSRKGLIIAIDLEKYDYSPGSQSLIRATEGTVIERLPPRIKIREKASLELPHVMLLIDDPEKTVIEPLAEKADSFEKVYDFDLMMNSGHIKGYKIDDEETIGSILSALEKLADPDTFRKKYSVGTDKDVLLFAVGDGNHSLATAKAHWELIKNSCLPRELESHPARYALVEVVNVHDSGLTFEPIHRVVFNINPDELLDSMVSFYKDENCSYRKLSSMESILNELQALNSNKHSHAIGFCTNEGFGIIEVANPSRNLEVGTLQAFLDVYIKHNNDIKVDYIHGEDAVLKLGTQKQNIGFFLPKMSKHDLFKTVILDGVLPRKTFSMGEADEKRFYLECRKITR
ncbi:DUF1015 domain-containing protein [Acetivibrio clariflavus]|uniref:DUF1015 domain-containing protein n=1 Tax=Acetivibrio clariflavus (strain DSM 19732 / NBRC 101661 / EBR45) TaxID=720554 RepID=G8LSN9_ACECE|nr:DUF1015 family protein [Acetivibrio clariflavus]AEV69391.1 hypothetical protein Clocl_2842 [Acetivibrio clariflavus DSM 19732]